MALAPVAGIPILHELEDGIRFGDAPGWTGSRAFDDPVRVRHRIGDVTPAGMRRLFDASPSCTYHAGLEGVAVEFRGPAPGVPDQLLRERRAGHDYDMSYAHAPAVPMYQRAKDRTILSMALAERGRGFIVHACGFLLEGAGVLCPGLPSAGKSTLAGLLMQAEVPLTMLSDDRIALTRESTNGFRIWGTPWPGDAKVIGAFDGPLQAIVLLRHGETPRLQPLGAEVGARRLLETLVLPLWDRRLLPGSLELVDRLVALVPLFEFSYPPTVGAVRSMLDALPRQVRHG